MGKDTLFWLYENEQAFVEGELTISREQLVSAVESAILSSGLDREHPSLASRLREVAKTKDKIASHTFKLVDKDCGCPMTEAGVVCFLPGETTINREEEKRKLGLSLRLMEAVDKFPGAFDQEMRRIANRKANFYKIRD